MCAYQYPNNQIELLSSEQVLLEQYFYITGSITSDCHDSLFESICRLAMFSYVQSIRKTFT